MIPRPVRELQQQSRIYTGQGARLSMHTSFGHMLRFTGSPADFTHPWLAQLAGANSATFLNGTINGVQAKIKGVPLEGDDKNTQPVLKWDKISLTDEGIGYLCAEITADPKLNYAISKIEMVQVADPDTDDGKPGKKTNASGGQLPISDNRARMPVAMIVQRSSGLLEIFQIIFFAAQHRAQLKADGVNVARHFFW